MTAFASNSILNRIGVAGYGMAPMDFAAIRVAAGAAMLWALVFWRDAPAPRVIGRVRWAGAALLAIYMIGFSWAYISLGAGLGALILFAVVQVVVFGWAVFDGQRIPVMRWIGAGVALLGLCVLLWPGGQAKVPFGGALAMIAAGVSWGGYTLLGRSEADALGSTASNFLLCVPLTGLAMLLLGGGPLPCMGVVTALVAGALTSGLGYALWYRILPQLPATIGAIAQLSVPVIAVAAGIVLLSEPMTLRIAIAGTLVLGGIALSVMVRR